MRVSILFLGALLLLGCSDPYKQTLPREGLEEESFQKAFLKLSEEDRALVAAFLLRREIGGAFGVEVQGHPLTIGEAISNQKSWMEQEAKRKEAEAREKAAAEARAEKLRRELEEKKRELRKAITVTVLELEFVPSNFRQRRYEDSMRIQVGLRNETDRKVEGIKGTIHFDDLFGDRVRSIGLSFDDGLDPRETTKWTGSIRHNEFDRDDVKLATTSLEKLRVTWDPEAIIFSEEEAASSD